MEKTTNILQNSFIYILLLLMPSVGYATQLSETVTSGEGESSHEDILALLNKRRELNSSLLEQQEMNSLFSKNITQRNNIIYKHALAIYELEKAALALKNDISKLSKENNDYLTKQKNLALTMKKTSEEIHKTNEKLYLSKNNSKKDFLVALIKLHISEEQRDILEADLKEVGGLNNAFKKIYHQASREYPSKVDLLGLFADISKNEEREVLLKNYNNGTANFDVQLDKVASSILKNHMLKDDA